jgi:hypothetical protein
MTLSRDEGETIDQATKVEAWRRERCGRKVMMTLILSSPAQITSSPGNLKDTTEDPHGERQQHTTRFY